MLTITFYKYIVRNFEWPSIYGSDRPIPFFGKFRITCPPRAVMTQRSGRNLGREDTMDGRDPTAGGENEQHRRSVHQQTSYRAGEILKSSSEHRTVNTSLLTRS